MYASAQSLDFLARAKNPRSPNRKPIISHPDFPDGNYFRKGEKGMIWEINTMFGK
jgi:hypothetical protein